MHRSWLLILAGVLAASPAAAEVLQLRTDAMPRPGHVAIVGFGSYAPFGLKVINSETLSANPPGSGYHWADVWTSVEAGLWPGVSVEAHLPYAGAQRFDGSGSVTGLGDLSFALSRRLYEDEEGAFKLSLDLGWPTADATLGFGTGVPALGLEASFRRELLRDRLFLIMNLGYLYHLRSTRDDATTRLPVTSWLGDRWQAALGLDLRVNARLYGVLELLAQADRVHEQNRQGVPQTGSSWVLLAPGAGVVVAPGVELQAGVVLPLFRGGYQDSFPYTAVVGTRVRL